MQVELSPEELDILLAWAEEATSPLVGIGAVYLTRAESDLLEKLRQARERSAHAEESMGGDPTRRSDGRSDH